MGLFGLLPLVGAGVKLAGSLFGGKKKKSGFGSNEMQNRWLSYLNQLQGESRDSNQMFLQALEGYDPRAALNEYAQGAWGNVEMDLKRTLGDLKGAAVGAGRLDTGFYDEDQGRIITDVTNRFTNQLREAALAASGQQGGVISMLNQRAGQTQNLLAEMLAGGMDFETAMANARNQKRASIFGGIGDLFGAGFDFWKSLKGGGED